VTLGALRGMGAGSILQFEGDPGRVAIMTGNRRIGTGTLLDIDGRPGIRIDSFSEGLDGDADHLDRGTDA
jgi:flagellar motor switch/type III secretory pathway protein FliN